MKKYILYSAAWALNLLNCITCQAWAGDPKSMIEKTYLNYNDVRCNEPQSSDCYNQVYSNIFKNTQAISNTSQLQTNMDVIDRTVNGYTKIHLYDKKPEFVIVTIHGLWYSADQFTATVNRLSELVPNVQFNKIELTLPGHIKSKLDENFETYYTRISESGNKPHAKYKEWLEALDNTIKLAKELGQKTIVIGHSTGGALAVVAALKYPEMVDHLVLLEPALQVQNLNNLESCLSRIFPDKLFTYFAKVFNVELRPHKDLGMGCQVQKLADAALVPYRDYNVGSHNIKPYEPEPIVSPAPFPVDDPEMEYTLENLEPYAEVGRKIKIPVLLFNNQHDAIVSPVANLYFFRGLNHSISRYVLITDKKIRHGATTSANPNFLAESIAQFIWTETKKQ